MMKDRILAEIKKTAAANGGVPLGLDRFASTTGIRVSEFIGKYWARWGDALREAGFKANQLTAARTDDDLLGRLASFTRELGHFPVANEIKVKARSEPGFPWHNTFYRGGGKAALAARLKAFCEPAGHDDVVV